MNHPIQNEALDLNLTTSLLQEIVERQEY